MSLPPDLLQRLAGLGVSPSDVEERFVRGAGPGGQKINKTSSTVWLRHAATGIEVRCQRERSQAANREIAWLELVARLEKRQRAAEEQRQHEHEKNRRRNRQKSRAQKTRMIASKKHRAKLKTQRRPGQVD